MEKEVAFNELKTKKARVIRAIEEELAPGMLISDKRYLSYLKFAVAYGIATTINFMAFVDSYHHSIEQALSVGALSIPAIALSLKCYGFRRDRNELKKMLKLFRKLEQEKLGANYYLGDKMWEKMDAALFSDEDLKLLDGYLNDIYDFSGKYSGKAA